MPLPRDAINELSRVLYGELPQEGKDWLARNGYGDRLRNIQTFALQVMLSPNSRYKFIVAPECHVNIAAYLLPLLQHIRGSEAPQRTRAPSCLVLAPTRMRARQIAAVALDIFGASDVFEVIDGGPQILNSIINLAVGTHSRIDEEISARRLDLTEIRFVVADEARRTLATKTEQTLFASPLPAAARICFVDANFKTFRNPVEFLAAFTGRVGDQFNLTQRGHPQPNHDPVGLSWSEYADEPERFRHLVQDICAESSPVFNKTTAVVIFCNWANDADALVEKLRADPELLPHAASIRALHTNIPNEEQDKTVADMKTKGVNVLVVTDYTTWGWHIDGLSRGIQYDFPFDWSIEYFVSRACRLGRPMWRDNTLASRMHMYVPAGPSTERDNFIQQLVESYQHHPELCKFPAQPVPR